MQINKKSWHYAAYRWTYTARDQRWAMSDTTNLCQYFQRIFWMVPITAVWIAFLSLVYVVLTPIVFLFGGRPHNVWKNTKKDFWTSYPGVKVWGEVRLHPWVIAIPTLFIYLEYLWFKHQAWYWPVSIQGGAIVFIGLLIAYSWYDTTDTQTVVNQWVAAKKQGICPVVEFIEE
jgi:hypothetical protein